MSILSYINDCMLNKEKQIEFQEAYENFSEVLFPVALNIIKDYQLSEDAVQIAYMKVMVSSAYKKFESMTNEEKKAFLIVVTRNVAIDICKDRKRYVEVSITEKNKDILAKDMSCDLSEVAMNNIQRQELAGLVQSLPHMYSDILISIYYFGYTAKEVARQFNIKEATVRKRVERGLRKLYKEYEKFN